MTRTRVFYGHEGVVPPTGSIPVAEAEIVETLTEAEVVDETLADEGDDEILAAEVVELELPDAGWKVSEIDAFAAEWGITFDEGAKKPAKLAVIEAWAAALPTGPE